MASAKLTPLGIAVLELLHEKPMHPYEMAQLMRERYVDTRVNVNEIAVEDSDAEAEA